MTKDQKRYVFELFDTEEEAGLRGTPIAVYDAEFVEQLRAALQQIKARVCGEAFPNWENTPSTGFSRLYIADVCDTALSGDSHG